MDPVFVIGNGSSNSARANAMTVLKNGKVGITTIAPQAKLHVSDGTAGGSMYNPAAELIIEDNADSYIQFYNATTAESGILSGNSQTDIRSALIFGADSTIMFRTGGNTTRLTIDKSGNTTTTGNSTISGNSTVSGNGTTTGISTTTGEIRRTATGAANIVPICYGSISPGIPPVIESGTGNFTVTNPATGQYNISITGEIYTNDDYTTIVTPVSSNFRTASVDALGNKLIVRIFDTPTTQVDNHFHFVVYQN